MIKLFEDFNPNYHLKSKAQELSSQLIKFTNEFFRDPEGWKESEIYPIAAWIKPDHCEIAFQYNDNELFTCAMLLSNDYIYFKFFLQKIYSVNAPIIKKYAKFGRYIVDIIRPLSENHEASFDIALISKDFFPLSISDVNKVIPKLNMEEYNFITDANNYNL